MRAVKGSLGHSLKRDMANRKALARANGTSRRASEWRVRKLRAVEDQSAPIPEEITSELGGTILYFKTFNFEPPKVTTPFQQKNILPRRRQLIGQGTSAWASADDDVVMGRHGGPL
jgi:hypothetical protein